jgi:hypothetical protein
MPEDKSFRKTVLRLYDQAARSPEHVLHLFLTQFCASWNQLLSWLRDVPGLEPHTTVRSRSAASGVLDEALTFGQLELRDAELENFDMEAALGFARHLLTRTYQLWDNATATRKAASRPSSSPRE